MRAISSVGQSWRLITAWSRVQVLDGPPKKSFCRKVEAFFIKGHPGLERTAERERGNEQSSGLFISPWVLGPWMAHQRKASAVRWKLFYRMADRDIKATTLPLPMKANVCGVDCSFLAVMLH